MLGQMYISMQNCYLYYKFIQLVMLLFPLRSSDTQPGIAN